MKHFLAYGNSDQESFRDPAVRDSFDVLTIPGTIASYYPDATAAFVLSCEKPYIIDPRTPLFQNRLESPRASHLTLAEWGGKKLRERLEMGVDPRFPTDFYTDAIIDELVNGMTSMQRSYADRRGDVSVKIDRYRRLLATATLRDFEEVGLESIPPQYLLAPYFAARNLDDSWWDVQNRIWLSCLNEDDAVKISPVVAIGTPSLLSEALSAIPAGLSKDVFFWVPDFDERIAELKELQFVMNAVRDASSRQNLVNLYGGFFSVCLGKIGLSGFSNGLGYSESRAWPELSATGAAPARYYLRDLHAFVSLAVAQQIVDADSSFACPCEVCEITRQSRRTIGSIGYHNLKKHFALSRKYEFEYVQTSDFGVISSDLESAFERITIVKDQLPQKLTIPSRHLHRWSDLFAQFR
jgi:hypothetical protein